MKTIIEKYWFEDYYISPAKSHGDSAGGDFGDAGSEDDGGRGIGAGQASGESEGHGEPVRNADDDVTNDLAGSEVLLFVLVEQPLLLGLQGYSFFAGGHWRISSDLSFREGNN